MGSPLGPIFANIFMSAYEQTWLEEAPVKPLSYRRYVDDTFLIFEPTANIKDFVTFLNSQHPNLRFTYEEEIDGYLPFIGITIFHVINKPVVHDNIVNTIPHRSYIADSFYLNPITRNEIATAMLSISNSKAVGSDGFSPIIIKQNINAISKQLEYIFNLSFSSGIFPKLLKSAIVTPLYKSGSVTEPGNYRPISILTIFSKLLEKTILQ